MATVSQCFHVIGCAVTEEERVRARRMLDNARRDGDPQLTVYLQMLTGPCTRTVSGSSATDTVSLSEAIDGDPWRADH